MMKTVVENEIGRLAGLEIGELRSLFAEYLSMAAPKNLSRQVLIGAIAYGLQERALDGLPASMRRQMDELAHSRKVARASTRGKFETLAD